MRQFSFCGFFAARSLSTASTSTDPPEVAPPPAGVEAGALPPEEGCAWLPEGVEDDVPASAAFASDAPNG